MAESRTAKNHLFSTKDIKLFGNIKKYIHLQKIIVNFVMKNLKSTNII